MRAIAAIAFVALVATGPVLAQEPLRFTSADVGGVKTIAPISLRLPMGSGRAPLVLLLHGCDGGSSALRSWADRIVRLGYAVALVDSFRPRGVKDVCGQPNEVPSRLRSHDVAAAVSALDGHPRVDTSRIAIIGFSHGGSTAIWAARADGAGDALAERLEAIIAFYPLCPTVPVALCAPVPVLIGDGDTWSPVRACTEMERRFRSAGVDVRVIVYPFATHAFDTNQPERNGFGHRMTYDPVAAGDAEERIREILRRRLPLR
jgi:dienelactone hydrolase